MEVRIVDGRVHLKDEKENSVSVELAELPAFIQALTLLHEGVAKCVLIGDSRLTYNYQFRRKLYLVEKQQEEEC